MTHDLSVDSVRQRPPVGDTRQSKALTGIVSENFLKILTVQLKEEAADKAVGAKQMMEPDPALRDSLIILRKPTKK